MKKTFFAFLFIFLTACSSALALNEQDSGKAFTVRIGQSRTISLSENPTTGYSWRFFITPENQQIISDIKETYIAPDTRLIGAGGIKKYSFTAYRKGKVTITGYYVRPWEKSNKENAQKVIYDFTVIE